MSGITLVGLGPGAAALLTRQAWELLSSAPEIYLRTRHHPVVAEFPAGLRVHSFDAFYENGESYEQIYTRIVEQVLQLAERDQGVVYGVPGHPFVAESTGPEIARRAAQAGIPVEIIEGMSFIEPTLTLLGLDPFPQTMLVDALQLAGQHHPGFPPDSPALIAQIHSARVASDVKLTLMAVYPDDHPVTLVHGAGIPAASKEMLPLYAIDRSPKTGLLTTLYVPALAPDSSFEAFQELIAHLRAPEGCPWDREQTHQTLRPHLLEEAYEVLEAIDADDAQAMREEFGDLLLQIVLHAQIASEYGEFSMVDVLRRIHEKIVRRHPHVFGNWVVTDKDAVLRNWEVLKATEREAGATKEASLLDGVGRTLPALAQAETYQKRAARVGFDWPDQQGVIEKVAEEIREFEMAASAEAREDELGDLLFSIVNLARWFDVDPESALRNANARFRRRFSRMEAEATKRGRTLSELSLEEMDALWEAAKDQD